MDRHPVPLMHTSWTVMPGYHDTLPACNIIVFTLMFVACRSLHGLDAGAPRLPLLIILPLSMLAYLCPVICIQVDQRQVLSS